MLVECDNEINMIVTDAIINYLWGEPECFFQEQTGQSEWPVRVYPMECCHHQSWSCSSLLKHQMYWTLQ